MAWTLRMAALLLGALAATPAGAECDVTAASSSDILVSLPAVAATPPMMIAGREVFACPRVAAQAACPTTARGVGLGFAPAVEPMATTTAALD